MKMRKKSANGSEEMARIIKIAKSNAAKKTDYDSVDDYTDFLSEEYKPCISSLVICSQRPPFYTSVLTISVIRLIRLIFTFITAISPLLTCNGVKKRNVKSN